MKKTPAQPPQAGPSTSSADSDDGHALVSRERSFAGRHSPSATKSQANGQRRRSASTGTGSNSGSTASTPLRQRQPTPESRGRFCRDHVAFRSDHRSIPPRRRQNLRMFNGAGSRFTAGVAAGSQPSIRAAIGEIPRQRRPTKPTIRPRRHGRRASVRATRPTTSSGTAADTATVSHQRDQHERSNLDDKTSSTADRVGGVNSNVPIIRRQIQRLNDKRRNTIRARQPRLSDSLPTNSRTRRPRHQQSCGPVSTRRPTCGCGIEPPAIGKVQVEVAAGSSGVTARLEVQSSAARQTLLDNISLLHTAITQTGASVNRIEVVVAPQTKDDAPTDQQSNSGGQQQASNQDNSQGGSQNQQNGQREPNCRESRLPLDQLDIEI